MEHRYWNRVGTWAFVALLPISLGMNVLQAQRIRGLVERPGDTRLVGTRVEALVGTTPEGAHASVALGQGEPVLVYHFSTSCHWCERNWANVEAIAEHANGRYRVLAITTEVDIAEWMAKRKLPFEVLAGVSLETTRRLGLSGTPQTIMVGGDGLVTHQWYGAYANRIGRQVADLFGMRMPGLTAGATPEARTEIASADQQ